MEEGDSYLQKIVSAGHPTESLKSRQKVTKGVGLSCDDCRNFLNAQILRSLEKLTKMLRMVEGLPLIVTGVHAASPAFRGTEPCLPLPYNNVYSKMVFEKENFLLPKLSCSSAVPWCPSIAVNISLETSGKWPDKLAAIGRLKAAFYLKFCQLIASQFNVNGFASSEHMDIFLDGFLFRVEILNSAELHAAKNESKHFVEFEKKIVLNPKICSYLKGFSQRWPLFGPVCCIGKRWLSAHMLSDYIEVEALELCVAYLFLQNYIATLRVGFEMFLNLFAFHDWVRSPLVLNLNDELEVSDIERIQRHFLSRRPTLPPICIYTPDDTSGTKYTRCRPIPVIVDRLKQLAVASLKLLNKGFSSRQHCEAVFKPVLKDFNAVIRLHKRCLPRAYQALSSTLDSREGTSRHRRKGECTSQDGISKTLLPVTDFDPAEEYLRDLKSAYGHVALFFHDAYGGDKVGVLWKPNSFAPTQFSLSNVNGRILRKRKRTKKYQANDKPPFVLVLDKKAVLEDFEIMGKGLVRSVEEIKSDIYIK